MYWFIEKGVAQDIKRAIDAGMQPSAEQREAFSAKIRMELEARDGRARNLSIAGEVAEIRVEGVLTEKLDLFMMLFGGGSTSYESIRSAMAEAEANPAVRRIQFLISSPGGTVEGLFETLAAIEAGKKPRNVMASHASSAAYAIASVAGNITATTPASMFGSVGVATSLLNLEEIVDITNTESPDKRPDVSTEEGKAVVRKHLDDLFEVFADVIARGRDTTVKDVTENFGRGATLIAKEAKARGMIDRVSPQNRSRIRAESDAQPIAEDNVESSTVRLDASDFVAATDRLIAAIGDKQNDQTPAPREEPAPDASSDDAPTPQRSNIVNTKEELKEKHPDLYAAVLSEGKEEARAEGHEAGVKEERSRVMAHLKMGKSSGAMEYAAKCIESGVSLMDQEVYAEYMSASMNKLDSDNRQADSDAAGAVVDNRQTGAEEQNPQKSVIDAALDLEAERVADVVEAKQ